MLVKVANAQYAKPHPHLGLNCKIWENIILNKKVKNISMGDKIF